MNFKSKDVITGFIIVLMLIVGLIWIFKPKSKTNLVVPVNTPTFEEKLKNKFPNFNIPNDINKIELKDVTGEGNIGVATETEVLASLPEPKGSEFYQVWSDDNGKLISLGKMRVAKGGYLYEGNLKNKKIVVSREKIFDNKIEVKILE